MEVTDLVDQLQSYLDNRIADVPVLVSGSESRPVPAILIEDWQITNLQGSKTSMNRYLTSLYDAGGNEQQRVYRIPYNARVSFVVRHRGEVKASRLHDTLRRELTRLVRRPQRLSDRVSRASLGTGGGMNHQFVNPTESEFTQSATFTSALVTTDDDWDRIEDIQNDIQITDTFEA